MIKQRTERVRNLLTLWTGDRTRFHLSFPSFAPGTELDKGLDDVIWVKATRLH